MHQNQRLAFIKEEKAAIPKYRVRDAAGREGGEAGRARRNVARLGVGYLTQDRLLVPRVTIPARNLANARFEKRDPTTWEAFG